MTCRAVLFDLDGTLLDTIEDIGDAANAALRQLGFPEHPLETYRVAVGDGMEVLARRVLPPECREAADVARYVAMVRKEYATRWAGKTRPFDGIPELLDELTARGIPIAVLSNKPEEFTRLCVEHLLPRWRFGAVVGQSARLPTKPDPAGALQIAAQLGCVPAEVLYLGDTNTDMRTAVAAGMFPAGALWGYRSRDELLAHGAKALVERPRDLLGLLDAVPRCPGR
ncbi:MAG: HAD family hydrolase [Thermoguttaceae bacterium]|jgi:phosphoglycolate phosphatase